MSWSRNTIQPMKLAECCCPATVSALNENSLLPTRTVFTKCLLLEAIKRGLCCCNHSNMSDLPDTSSKGSAWFWSPVHTRKCLISACSWSTSEALTKSPSSMLSNQECCRSLKYSPATPAPVGKCSEKVAGSKYFSNFLHKNRWNCFNHCFRSGNKTAANPNHTP